MGCTVKPCTYPHCDCSPVDVEAHGCGLSAKLERQTRDLVLFVLGLMVGAGPLLAMLTYRGWL